MPMIPHYHHHLTCRQAGSNVDSVCFGDTVLTSVNFGNQGPVVGVFKNKAAVVNLAVGLNSENASQGPSYSV